jgi:hypothetical protein
MTKFTYDKDDHPEVTIQTHDTGYYRVCVYDWGAETWSAYIVDNRQLTSHLAAIVEAAVNEGEEE